MTINPVVYTTIFYIVGQFNGKGSSYCAARKLRRAQLMRWYMMGYNNFLSCFTLVDSILNELQTALVFDIKILITEELSVIKNAMKVRYTALCHESILLIYM